MYLFCSECLWGCNELCLQVTLFARIIKLNDLGFPINAKKCITVLRNSPIGEYSKGIPLEYFPLMFSEGICKVTRHCLLSSPYKKRRDWFITIHKSPIRNPTPDCCLELFNRRTDLIWPKYLKSIQGTSSRKICLPIKVFVKNGV